MAFVKEESQECELKQMLNQQKCELKPVGKIKQEAHKPVLQDESDTEDGCHLKIITLQEAKKEEIGDWDLDAFETSIELNTNTHDVNQGLSLEGRLNESCDNGMSFLAAGGNLTQSPINTGEKTYQCSQYGETHTRNGDSAKPTGKKYCCSHCGKTFATLIHFIVHQQIHRGDGRGERPFHCSQCGKSFYREKGLKTHLQSHKGERPHRCSKCGKLFTVKSLLLSHQRSHTRERRYHCSKCAQSFASKAKFERHMQVYLEEILYSCSQCKKNFMTECSLNRHKQTHIRKETNSYFKQLATKEKIYSCSHCSRSFTVLTNYIVHQQIHRGEGTEERPFCCLLCGKRFYREYGLKLHEQSHRTEKIHCCSECGKSFRTESVLISHKCTCIKKRHYCSKCGRSFTLKSTFESHMQMHSGEKKYNVSPSVKSLPSESSRRRLKETHAVKEQSHGFQQAASKTKSYSCSHCGRTFTMLTNYIVHQQIHRGEGREERPFCCSQCGKRFYKEDSLKKHHQIHTGGRAHQCSQCGKSFRTKSVLLSHQNIHERQKQYHHLKPDGGFASKSNSDEDIHMHSRERLHNCSWCGEMFSTEYFLKRHQQSHCKKRSLGCFKQIQTKQYCCSNCGKVFTTLTNFVVHQQIHRGQGRGERPVYFSQSGKCFYRENGLKSHQQTPTGERRPENDTLISKTHFGKPMTEGLGSYPFSYGEKTFTTSSIVKQHQQKHTSEEMGCDGQVQYATRETVLGDSCLANNNSASTENSGGGEIVLGKDRKREIQNTMPFKTSPKFDMDEHSIPHRVHLDRFSNLQTIETCQETLETPHVGFDIIPQFYPDVCHRVESSGSTSADGVIGEESVRTGEVLKSITA
ncbi:zinc finger protein 271-like [Conger conger]|uniref:zinc finger protein 271-like n=1 Tax=Conger conger TaxID=82655 RepID=UPI002A5A4C7C|nr:zinc finger protein 271-like [Conger conger]